MSKNSEQEKRRTMEIGKEQFYTNEKLAQRLVTEVLSLGGAPYDLTVEPSAGKGAFSNAAPGHVVAYDLEPKAPGIIQADWFQVQPEDLPEHSRLLVVGNPPFGRHGKVAEEFIRHSIEVLGATTIAFILPQSFGKYNKQGVFPSDWRLIRVVELNKKESTFEYEGKPRWVPCDFFVWTRDPDLLTGVDRRDRIWDEPKEFTVVKPADVGTADISVNKISGKVRSPEAVGKLMWELLLKVNEGYDKEEVIEKIRAVRFRPLSGGGPPYLNTNSMFGDYHRHHGE